MNNLDTQLKKFSHVRMTEQEKNGIRSSLLHYAFTNPYVGSKKTFFQHLQVTWQVALVVIFCIATSGSVSAAADSALPGDLLYPIKVHVNEEVKGFIASTTPEKKIEWQKERIKTRIKETETLVAQKTLTPQKQTVIEKTLKTQVDEFTKTAEVSAKSTAIAVPEKALRASLELEMSLKDHQNKLTITEVGVETAAQSVNFSIAKTVEESVETLSKKTDEIILEKIDLLDKEIEKVPLPETDPTEVKEETVTPKTETPIEVTPQIQSTFRMKAR